MVLRIRYNERQFYFSKPEKNDQNEADNQIEIDEVTDEGSEGIPTN